MIFRSLLAAAALSLCLVETSHAEDAQRKQIDTYELLNLFGDVFERVRADYVEQTSDEQLIEAAVNGMLSALDPHSSYLDAKKYEDMKVQTQGTFGGLGIEVTMEAGLVKVVTPIDDTPAFRAGLKPGDFVTHIDGAEVLGMNLAEAVEKMRGRIGSSITLSIRRADREPFDVTLTREEIKIRSVRSRLEGRVGYIRISSFSEQTDEGVRSEIAKLKKEAPGGLQGLVVDLRNNPGGLLSQAVAVSDDFLEQGEIVSTRTRKPEDTQRFNARPGDIADDLPIVVLVNAGTASASEIVAGALQDHGRAILLGTKSFGKGSVQTIIPLVGHGAMRLTTARYYTPSGRSIQAVGIEPDIVVEQAKIETMAAQGPERRESDLRGALDLIGSEVEDKTGPADDGPKPGEAENGPLTPETDYQLVRAIDLVRGLSLFSEKLTQRAQ